MNLTPEERMLSMIFYTADEDSLRFRITHRLLVLGERGVPFCERLGCWLHDSEQNYCFLRGRLHKWLTGQVVTRKRK